MTRSYYYLGGDELHTGMYVALIRRLEREGLVVNLVARLRVSPSPLAILRAWKNRHSLGPNPIADVRSQLRGEVHPVPLWAPLPALSVPFFVRILGGPTDSADGIVMHTRQIVMGRLALALRRWWHQVRVISEMEGDPLAELHYNRIPVTRPSLLTRLRWLAEDRYYSRQERRLVHESDAVICVSQRLKDLLIARYRLTPDQSTKISVFPSVGDPNVFQFDPDKREALRRDLGLERRYVVVYSGNLGARWQLPDKLVEMFGLIRQIRPDAYFLILTPEKDRHLIEPHLKGARLSAADYGMHSCQHREVARYLCGGDVGLLLRDRHLMNEVAAPGKFSEYMLTGLPIIMTEGIGDFSAQMRDSEFACVLPGLDELHAQRQRIQAFCGSEFTAGQRARLSRWAAERFSTELRIPQLVALYRTV
jgi:glycosyltransferase involved in cell wall biosynthesis